MKKFWLVASLWTLSACTEDVPVTEGNGNDGTSETTVETRFADQLVPKCKQVCDVISPCKGVSKSCTCEDTGGSYGGGSTTEPSCTCADEPMSLNECTNGCVETFGERALYKGEACASLALQSLDCLAKLTCSAFESSDAPCALDAFQSMCPKEDTGDVSTSPAPVPTSAVGGTAGTDPIYSGGSGGSSSGTPAATATCSTSSGSAPPLSALTGIVPGQLLCNMNLDLCSNGHAYAISCSATESLTGLCSCMTDGVVVSQFEDAMSNYPYNMLCTRTSEVIQRCGWPITG